MHSFLVIKDLVRLLYPVPRSTTLLLITLVTMSLPLVVVFLLRRRHLITAMILRHGISTMRLNLVRSLPILNHQETNYIQLENHRYLYRTAHKTLVLLPIQISKDITTSVNSQLQQMFSLHLDLYSQLLEQLPSLFQNLHIQVLVLSDSLVLLQLPSSQHGTDLVLLPLLVATVMQCRHILLETTQSSQLVLAEKQRHSITTYLPQTYTAQKITDLLLLLLEPQKIMVSSVDSIQKMMIGDPSLLVVRPTNHLVCSRSVAQQMFKVSENHLSLEMDIYSLSADLHLLTRELLITQYYSRFLVQQIHHSRLDTSLLVFYSVMDSVVKQSLSLTIRVLSLPSVLLIMDKFLLCSLEHLLIMEESLYQQLAAK